MGSKFTAWHLIASKQRYDDEARLSQCIPTYLSGIAVAAVTLDLGFRKVDLSRTSLRSIHEISLGHVATARVASLEGAGEEPIRGLLHLFVAGELAELRINPNAVSYADQPSGKAEMREAAELAIFGRHSLADSPAWFDDPTLAAEKVARVQALVDSTLASTERLVDEHWRAIVKVAKVLSKKRLLRTAEVSAIVEGETPIPKDWFTRPRIAVAPPDPGR